VCCVTRAALCDAYLHDVTHTHKSAAVDNENPRGATPANARSHLTIGGLNASFELVHHPTAQRQYAIDAPRGEAPY
jgi:hypothetical protein